MEKWIIDKLNRDYISSKHYRLIYDSVRILVEDDIEYICYEIEFIDNGYVDSVIIRLSNLIGRRRRRPYRSRSFPNIGNRS